MKHSNHFQYPYSSEIKRRLFISKTERRCKAVYDFLLALLCCSLFAAIGVMLAWRG